MTTRKFANGDYVYFNGAIAEIKMQVVDNVRAERNGTYIIRQNGEMINNVQESEMSHEAPVVEYVVTCRVSMIERLSHAMANCN